MKKIIFYFVCVSLLIEVKAQDTKKLFPVKGCVYDLETKEQLPWQATSKTTGLYVSSIRPKSGELVKIEVTTEFGTVWAEDKVPDITEIEDIKATSRLISSGNTTVGPNGGIITESPEYEILYQITFQDNFNEENYYLIMIDNMYLGAFDYSLDPVFTNQETLLSSLGDNQRGLFSDETINGKKYTLTIKEYDVPEEPIQRKISLYSLSKAYYLYLCSLQDTNDESVMQNLSNLGLSEPLRIYSNVNRGTGILGSSQRFEWVVNF
jgi:hypothetical protein